MLDVFFVGVADYCRLVAGSGCLARAAFHMDRVFRRREGAVGFVFDIEIAEGDGRNSVVARAARYCQILDGLGATHAGRRGVEVIGHLRVVRFESFRPVDGGRLDQFHVSRTADVDLDGHRIVGLQFGLRDRGRHGELTHASGETCGFSARQGRHMNGHTRRGEHLRDIGVGSEEIIEDRAHALLGLYAKNRFELRRINRDVAGVLRVENGTVEHGGLIVAAVVVLQLRLYLALLQILLEEACELRQLGVVGQLGYVHVREIQLIRHQQRLLLMHTRLRSDGTNEDVLRRDIAALRGLRALSTLSILIIRSTLSRLFVLGQHSYPHTVGLHALAVHFDGCGRDGEGTGLLRHQRVGVGLLESRGAMTVDKRSTATGRGVGTGQVVKVRELRRAQVPAALVDAVGQLERAADNHLRRRLRPKNDLIGIRTECDADKDN